MLPDFATFFYVGFVDVVLPCIHLWGFAYLLILVYFLHRLVYQKSSQMLTVFILVPTHFVFSAVQMVLYVPNLDIDFFLKAVAVLFILVLPLTVTLVAHRLQGRRKHCSQQVSIRKQE